MHDEEDQARRGESDTLEERAILYSKRFLLSSVYIGLQAMSAAMLIWMTAMQQQLADDMRAEGSFRDEAGTGSIGS